MSVPQESTKLGLALGSGAARGLAHIGVLKVLEQSDIRIDLIAGTSIGAFIGALYAAGVPIRRMEEAALELDWRQMTRWLDPVLPTSGLIDGSRLTEFMAELLPVRTFEELRMPFAITATDIHTGEAVTIKQGNLLEALRAGLAFPGIFSPAPFGKRFLVDGGLCNPVPADVVRRLGAAQVIGVCAIPEVKKEHPETFLPVANSLKHQPSRANETFSARIIEQVTRRVMGKTGVSTEISDRKAPNIFRVCAQSVAIMENVINDLKLHQNHHDLFIRPLFNDITLLEFHRAQEIITAGEQATLACLPAIQQLLRKD